MIERVWNAKNLIRLAVTLLSLAVLAGGISLAGQFAPTAPTPTVKAPVLGGEQKGYIPAGGSNVKGESGELLGAEDYWYTRIGYPTGKFDARWLLNAALQDKQVAKGVPAGVVTYNKDASNSPLTLDPAQWTSLGPQPLQSNGCS